MISKYKLYTLKDSGMSATLTDYGARLMSLVVPGRDGNGRDVLLGFDSAEEYENDHGTYFGATIGRVANRIGHGKFTLDGNAYSLALNDNGKNHLHGGIAGFDKRVFEGRQTAENCVEFRYVSPDGEEGYPSAVDVRVKFTLSRGGLEICYDAISDGDTLLALTNHAYFNLDGDGKSVLNQEVFIDADSLSVVDGELIPTGERMDLTSEDNAAYSFLKPHAIGAYLKKGGELMRLANGGYDFCYNFKGGADCDRPRATAYSPASGIKMSVYTDLNAMQFYSGNFLDGFEGKRGQIYQKHAAFCMETGCDISSLAARTLRAGERYHTVTRYQFERIE